MLVNLPFVLFTLSLVTIRKVNALHYFHNLPFTTFLTLLIQAVFSTAHLPSPQPAYLP